MFAAIAAAQQVPNYSRLAPSRSRARSRRSRESLPNAQQDKQMISS